MEDVRDLHNRSIAGFTKAVAEIGDDAWARATPCDGWSVRDLVNHVVAEELWTAPLLEGRTIVEVGDRYDGDVLGLDPVKAAGQAGEAAVRAAERVDLDATVHLSFGDVPARFYLEQLFADHVVHVWDLSAATGGAYPMEADLVDECTRWFERHEDEYRAAGVIGNRPTELPDGGLARLLVMFGREPNWASQ